MTTADAIAHFSAKLAYEIDVLDVHRALESGSPGFVLLDSRAQPGWDQGHIRGAHHVPTAQMAQRVPTEYAVGTEFVVYCWGPGCNGATRAALVLSEAGFSVREMIGGFEYWAREGLPVDSASGDATREPDPLTAPVPTDAGRIDCDC